MAIFQFSFNAIAPLILLVLLGYFLSRRKIISDAFIRDSSKIIFQIAIPVSLFLSISGLDLRTEIDWPLYLLTSAGILLTFLILMLAVPRFVRGNPQRGAMIHGIFRGNYLLLGYPLARNLFGEAGVVPVTMLLPVVSLLYNLLGVLVMEYYCQTNQGLKWRKVILGVLSNPLIIGAALGAAFSLLRLQLPVFLDRVASDIAAIAYPLALIMMGGQFKFSRLAGNKRLLTAAAIARMAIVPAIMISTAVLLGFSGPRLGAVFILFCAPTAISSYILAANMNGDADLAGQIVLLTTLLSGFTLFAGAYVLRALALI
jgi:hypothetical protein